MTSRQRVQAALRHQEPDRTPVFEYVLLAPVAEALLGRPFVDCSGGRHGWGALIAERGWEGAVRQYAADQVALAELLGHDLLYVVPNPPPPADRPAAETEPAPQPGDDPVERVRRRTEAGMQAPPRVPEHTLLVYVLLREEMRRRGLDLPVLAPAYGHGVWTDTDLMQTMVLEPEVAHAHFALATRRCLAAIEAYLEVGVDQFGVGGDFAGNRPMISPQAYREFIMPEVRTLSRRIHAAGKWAVNASDGNLWSVIDDFLIGCEVDGYLEIDAHAGMDLRALKERYGDRVTLYGNMDCGTLLTFGSPEEIRRATHDCLTAGWGNGGHIFTASNAITASVPVENYLAMVNAYREHFGLSPLRP